VPTVVILFSRDDWPRWTIMWLLSAAIFGSCKWLTWRTTSCIGVPAWKLIGYLLAWPGMDAAAFLHTSHLGVPPLHAWLFPVGKVVLGIGLVWGVVPVLPAGDLVPRGWVGMVGVVFVLHFGLFHLLSLLWQSIGVSAKPLMDWPVLSTSVSEFWGRRWNRAFRDLTYRYLFRPLTARFGPSVALIAGFLVSGVVHDLVISLPARGGYGRPTAYFLLQAAAIFGERSRLGQRLGLAHGWRGWAFTMLVLLGPVTLLFHPPFVLGIVVPFIDWLIGVFHE
jgi:hypothetical protein